MSWDCPHLSKDYYCNRLRIKCDPACKGCVLQGKVNPITGTLADSIKMLDKKKLKKDNQFIPTQSMEINCWYSYAIIMSKQATESLNFSIPKWLQVTNG